jgi:colicin import membrane protein
MTNDDADGGVRESVAANMRAAAVMAMQVGERLAKAWTDLARDAERRATTEAGLLAARIEAERATVVATLTLVDRPDWWDRASIDEVAGMLETATTWHDRDLAAAHALTVIEREVQDRYGLTAEALQQYVRAGHDRTEAIETIAAAEALDRLTDGEQARADVLDDASNTETARATDPSAEQGRPVGDRGGDADREAGDLLHDSAARRDAFAAALEGSAEPDLIAGRIRADQNFAHPAEQSTPARSSSLTGPGRTGSAPDRPRQRPARTR